MNDETKTLSRKARTLSPNERVALVEDVLESWTQQIRKRTSFGRGKPPIVWRPIVGAT
jgi:hypothetical protein